MSLYIFHNIKKKKVTKLLQKLHSLNCLFTGTSVARDNFNFHVYFKDLTTKSSNPGIDLDNEIFFFSGCQFGFAVPKVSGWDFELKENVIIIISKLERFYKEEEVLIELLKEVLKEVFSLSTFIFVIFIFGFSYFSHIPTSATGRW